MWTLGYFAKNSTALSYHGMRFNNVDAIIATDLDTLAAGIVLKERLNTTLIYDAHEFWPESDPLNASWEKNFWKSIEKTLLPSVDFAITVSPNLAQYMTSLYKHPFNAIPNAEPLISDKKYSNKVRLVSNSDDVAFLYQGNYAVGRGLRLLLDAWPSTDKKAKLFLRGMPNEYGDALEKIAASSGLLHKRIFFLDPVPENELVASAKSADVGIIPYAPVCVNHKYCCPNKLSQYCQAALPILANNTEFIADVVTRNRLGRVVDFNDRDELIRSVNYFTHEKSERLDAAYNAREFSKKYFHWEYVSQPLYKFILQTKTKKEALESTTNHTFLTPELNLQETTSNESQFTPELNVQEDNFRQKIVSKLRQLYIYISSNQSINRTYSYRFVRFFWRLLPDSFKSRYSP
jgi:glycosyltransferase involved in cell wall biosynthesis